MKRPRKLKKGDTVGLICPCSPVCNDKIKPSIQFFNDLGFNVALGMSVTSSHGFLAGCDDIRAADMNNMFMNEKIKGVFCMRGGYGASRILDKLDFKMIKKNPKIFAGYSDVTILLDTISEKCGFVTYHAPMVASNFIDTIDEYTLNMFKRVIFKDDLIRKIENPIENGEIKCLVSGKCKGILTGGNLSLVVSSIGTDYEVNTKKKIVFLEEVSEPPYKIDKMLLQLVQSNKLKDACGIIFGSFTDCKAKDETKSLSIEQILNELIVPLNKPTIYNVSCGHSEKTISLPIGGMFYMDSGKKIIREI